MQNYALQKRGVLNHRRRKIGKKDGGRKPTENLRTSSPQGERIKKEKRGNSKHRGKGWPIVNLIKGLLFQTI